VVSYLTEELVRMGHDVTLFASGDSETRAELVPCCPKALRLAGAMARERAYHRDMFAQVYRRRHEFEIIHLHTDDWHLREPRLLNSMHATTVHGRLDTKQRAALYEGRRELPLISISHAQRRPLKNVSWLGNVYHGFPDDLYQVHPNAGDYLVFVGRISHEKRIDRAIDIAGRYGMKLKVAAKVDDADYSYYCSVRDKLRSPWVEFVGEADDAAKNDLLGGAYAFLFPIDWPEPFGLAMVEAMLTGTPVIAWRHGSVPEVVDEGLTGFVVDEVGGALTALDKVKQLDRTRCAARARARFSARHMAQDYVDLYRKRTIADAPSGIRPRIDFTGDRHAGLGK
jgi:glycosyltransferase involved in cell wall biosynthesis